ncbi:uncharacterized protein TNCV_4007951 [Trichonephila clavipes]|nr:uncharacterized protein TNCV_4007951 [Trichonephila clavipes]
MVMQNCSNDLQASFDQIIVMASYWETRWLNVSSSVIHRLWQQFLTYRRHPGSSNKDGHMPPRVPMIDMYRYVHEGIEPQRLNSDPPSLQTPEVEFCGCGSLLFKVKVLGSFLTCHELEPGTASTGGRCSLNLSRLKSLPVVVDEVEKLAYQLNEEAERTERPIRRLSKVMYGSTCPDMQVDVMGECLSSIKHVVGVRSVFLAKRLHAV